MAKHLSELCVLLVEDIHGELASQVFHTLGQWGRITLQALLQHSELPPRHVRHGLTVLIQQHLVFHYTADDHSPTYYEVDWDGAYHLVRSGKIVAIVEQRYGSGAAQVISNLLQLGHAKVGDLEVAYKFPSDTKSSIDSAAEHINGEGLPNGLEKGKMSTKGQDKKIESRTDLHRVLIQLLEVGFIHRVHKRTFYSAPDRHNDLETTVMRKDIPDGKVTGPKARERFLRAINERKRKWQEKEDVVSPDMFAGHNSDKPPQKRPKLNGGMNGIRDHEKLLQSGVILKVNFHKCNVAMRSQQFERFAIRYFGETTATVYGTLLQLLERKIQRCHDDRDADEAADLTPSATTQDVLGKLDPNLDLMSSIAPEEDDEDLVNGHDEDQPHDMNGTKVKRENAGDSSYSSYETQNKRLRQIEQHLRLLAEHPRSFVRRIGTRGGGEWYVDHATLTSNLHSAEIEGMISAKFGSLSARLVRLLKSKGKLEQKMIQDLAMIRKNDALALLTTMQGAGMIETQEVPRDAARQPSRAFYLWYFDQERVVETLLIDLYKAMARAIQRVKVQKDYKQDVIDKAERLDVVGHEDEYLTNSDKAHLREWREEEERLLTQLMRQDDMVALLRDF